EGSLFMLTKEIADKIVQEAGKKMKFNINVINNKGVIISSKDQSREGEFHEGGSQVINAQRSLEVSSKSAEQLKGTHIGINLPIIYNKEIVGVIGITGDPSILEKYKKIASLTATSIMHYHYLVNERMWRKNVKENLIRSIVEGSIN